MFLFFLQSPQAWVLAIVVLFVICTVALILLTVIGYRMTTRASRRYPAAPVGGEGSADVEAPPTSNGRAALATTAMHPELRSIGGRRVSCEDRWAA
jgi:hypothetical protein